MSMIITSVPGQSIIDMQQITYQRQINAFTLGCNIPVLIQEMSNSAKNIQNAKAFTQYRHIPNIQGMPPVMVQQVAFKSAKNSIVLISAYSYTDTFTPLGTPEVIVNQFATSVSAKNIQNAKKILVLQSIPNFQGTSFALLNTETTNVPPGAQLNTYVVSY